MDYYGFTPQFYELKFSSRGDAQLSQRVVELFNQVTLSDFPFHTSLFLSDFSVALRYCNE
jgi:aromatic ring-opening dioxygenase catalytic subunit (LigB family)